MNDDEAREYPPYPPHIAALVDDARPLDEAPARAKADVRARVMATVGAAAAVTAATNTAQSTATATSVAKPAASWFGAKGLWLALGVGAVGLVLALLRAPKNDASNARTHNQTTPTIATSNDAGATSASTAGATEVEDASSVTAAADDAQAPSVVASAADAAVSARPAIAQDTLVEEQRLLDRARGALASGDHDGARSALARHRQRFSRGQLSMERDALEVRALLAAGRADEARAAASRFASRWPTSPLRSAVEAMVR
ncbi:MAG: hypothetical protein JNK05_06205 [Myxococcales bacterium]|nr:hypothetical protein [Myxococcales bacterium]